MILCWGKECIRCALSPLKVILLERLVRHFINLYQPITSPTAQICKCKENNPLQNTQTLLIQLVANAPQHSWAHFIVWRIFVMPADNWPKCKLYDRVKIFLTQPHFSLKERSAYYSETQFVFSPSEPKSKGRILYQCLTIIQGEENFDTGSTQ